MADSGSDEHVVTPRVRRAGLTPGSVALLVITVVGAFVLRDVFVAAHRTIGWVVACSVVALLIDPLVDVVDRALPRWIAVIVVLLGVLTVVATVTVGLANDLLESLDELTRSAPQAAAELAEQHDSLAQLDIGQRVEDFVDDLNARVRKDAVSQAAETAPSYVVTGILMLFILAFGRRYFEGFVDQFPERHREDMRTVGRSAALRGRQYLLVALGQSVVNGVIVGSVCWALGFPAAISLGFAVGVFTLLPLIGVLVGGIPALLLGFGLEGWEDGMIVLAVLIGLQTIEAAVVRPIVDARTVRVGPTIPIIVALLGFELYGVGGAIYSIALAVIALAALDAVGRLRGDDLVLGAAPEPPESVAPLDADADADA
ncbi:MAG: AI-2E family transporter, partial [Ilumatobacteraceae bacterium]